MLKPTNWIVLACSVCGISCGAEPEGTAEGSAPADLLEIVGGRAGQWNGAISRAAFSASLGGTDPGATPNDTSSYVGASKVFGPGIRFDLYYIAIAGSDDVVGDLLCVAPAQVSTRPVAGFEPTERLVATEVWGADTCGWDLSGMTTETVYAWDSAGQRLRMWALDSEGAADLATPPGEDFLKLCENPTVPLSNGALAQHPSSVCDLDALHGPGNYRLSTEPWRFPDSSDQVSR